MDVETALIRADHHIHFWARQSPERVQRVDAYRPQAGPWHFLREERRDLREQGHLTGIR
jgi:hypothetical protein